MIGWLNIGSLVFGLIAWILPIVNLMRYSNQGRNNWIVLTMISMSACAISLFFQIFNSYYRVKLEDWSALMDIMGAKIFITAILLFVTIILNVMTLIIYRNRDIN